MDGTDLAKIVMNPVRMRIAQYLLLHEHGTTVQIGEELSDVPKASLYRHMRILEDAGLIQVVQENKKRGTVEKVYKLNQENPSAAGSLEKRRSDSSYTAPFWGSWGSSNGI